MTSYAKAVKAGRIPCGRLVRLAAERHLDDLKTGKKRGLTFDVEASERAIAFFGQLRHYKGEWAGQPLTLSPWQAFIVGSIMGWKGKDGLRRFREAYEEVPRKNGKSTKDAGLALLLAFFDREAGAEAYCAATKKDQARIIFGDAKQMALRTPALKKRLQVFVNNLSAAGTSSKLEPLGADEDTMDGLNVHVALIDEVHKHRTSGVVDVLKTATGARRQPLIKYVTTAGYDRNSVCWRLHEYGAKVLEGTVKDDTFFAFIACADEGDDWRSPETWAKANPNLGISVHVEDLARKAKHAEHVPADQNVFRRLHLNEWTEQEERWLDVALWDRGKAEAQLEGRCYAGLRLGAVNDISAFLLVFGPDGEGFVDVACRFWVPEESVGPRTDKDRVPYRQWVSDGLVVATPGNITDHDFIEKAVLELCHEHDVLEVAYDKVHAPQLVTHLMEHGVTMVPTPMGFLSLGGPTKELQRLVEGGKLRHGGNPVLRWMASNTAVRQDPVGNLKPDQSKSAEKIDGIFALVMALGRGMTQKPAVKPSITFFGDPDDPGSPYRGPEAEA